MFERFTHAARETVVRAQAEARDLQQSPIGTQHILLALLADPEGPVAMSAALRDKEVDARRVRAEILRRVGPDPEPVPLPDADAEDKAALKAIGIDLDAVRRAIEENFGPGTLHLPRRPVPKRKGLLSRFGGKTGHVPFSPRAKKILELSLREAIRLKQNFIAPEHIMLGIVREGSGLATQILAEHGVDLGQVRQDMERSLTSRVA